MGNRVGRQDSSLLLSGATEQKSADLRFWNKSPWRRQPGPGRTQPPNSGCFSSEPVMLFRKNSRRVDMFPATCSHLWQQGHRWCWSNQEYFSAAYS